MIQKSPKDTRKILQTLPVRAVIAGLNRIKKKCDPDVYGFYNMYGVKTPTQEALDKQKRNYYIVLLWATTKLSYSQIAKEYNLNKWTIRKIITNWWWGAIFRPADKNDDYGADIDITQEYFYTKRKKN